MWHSGPHLSDAMSPLFSFFFFFFSLLPLPFLSFLLSPKLLHRAMAIRLLCPCDAARHAGRPHTGGGADAGMSAAATASRGCRRWPRWAAACAWRSTRWSEHRTRDLYLYRSATAGESDEVAELIHAASRAEICRCRCRGHAHLGGALPTKDGATAALWPGSRVPWVGPPPPPRNQGRERHEWGCPVPPAGSRVVRASCRGRGRGGAAATWEGLLPHLPPPCSPWLVPHSLSPLSIPSAAAPPH